jgi:hypothetical protein
LEVRVVVRRTITTEVGHAAIVEVANTGLGEIDRRTLRTALIFTLQLLAQKAPGSAVEIRIPPLAAIQAIPGPKHRRGTPPAVIEMDPSTWLDLATGATTWEQARSSGLLRASGERADLTAWLPLVSVADQP